MIAERPTSDYFDIEYYRGIWAGVHRHDYCEDLANLLVRKYGQCRLLDVGTGCGYLVKKLREKGCDAMGVDLSKFAVANSHGNVLEASVLDLPFQDKRFDVVYSQGLWENILESDVDQAWSECLRVGWKQEHNYDAEEQVHLPEFKEVTIKPRIWWEAKLVIPRILVACPNHECKEYSFQRWIDNVKSFTYPAYDILVVDNTEHDRFYQKWKDRIPMLHFPISGSPEERINRSMGVIREKFLAGNYSHWFNVESDIIPPKDAIERMLEFGKGMDWISCAYPSRIGTEDLDAQRGIGCSILSRHLMENFSFQGAWGNCTPDGYLWRAVGPRVREFPTLESWGLLKVSHLRESK